MCQRRNRLWMWRGSIATTVTRMSFKHASGEQDGVTVPCDHYTDSHHETRWTYTKLLSTTDPFETIFCVRVQNFCCPWTKTWSYPSSLPNVLRQAKPLVSCEVWTSDRKWSLVGCGALWQGEQLPAYQRIVALSSSSSNITRRTKMEVLRYLEVRRYTPGDIRHITEESTRHLSLVYNE
jgi:hypothetical protein